MATTYLYIAYMDQPRKVAKPARGQLYPWCKYIYICTGTVLLLFVLVYIPDIFFIWGHVHSCMVHCFRIICIYICV